MNKAFNKPTTKLVTRSDNKNSLAIPVQAGIVGLSITAHVCKWLRLNYPYWARIVDVFVEAFSLCNFACFLNTCLCANDGGLIVFAHCMGMIEQLESAELPGYVDYPYWARIVDLLTD